MSNSVTPIEELLAAAAAAAPEQSSAVFHPRLFDAATQLEQLTELLESGAVRTYRDCYRSQLRELGITRHPEDELFATERADVWVEAQIGSERAASQGVYVFYPWSGVLIHVLGEDAFFELRTNRNRYKITELEQETLRQCTIGVVGLSVGHAAATTLALEGIGGRFRLADYDVLELSNLNRIRSRLEMLGLNKAVIAARELFELNPFLHVEVFANGIDPGNIASFLAGPPKLDLLVEECDDFFAKLKLREYARDLGIPVIMDTSDRGMLDIERFDREPDRPVFHGLLSGLTADDVRGLTTKQKVPYVLRALGEDNLSSRLAASMLEVKQSIYTWPQLGSAVTLGGALVAHSARRVLLAESTSSGRYLVDLDQLVANETGQVAPEAPASALIEVPTFDFDTAVPQGVDRAAQIRWMVAAAHLAPSAGNQQPWRFVLRSDGRLILRRPEHLKWSFLDYQGLATEVALGAAVENLSIAASHLALRIEVDVLAEDGERQIRFISDEGSATHDPLLEAIPKRLTERRHDAQPELPPGALDRIMAAAVRPVGSLFIRSEREVIEGVANLVAAADRFTYLHPVTHRELMGELRWTDEEACRRRDGIRVNELKLTPFDEAGLRLARKPEVVRWVKKVGGGAGVGKMSRAWFQASAAVGLYVASESTSQGAFEAGRAIQRVWLTATAAGVGLHPLTGLLYLGTRAERGGEGLSDTERVHLADLLGQVRSIFCAEDEQLPLLLFRLIPASAGQRHLRLDLDDVFCSESV